MQPLEVQAWEDTGMGGYRYGRVLPWEVQAWEVQAWEDAGMGGCRHGIVLVKVHICTYMFVPGEKEYRSLSKICPWAMNFSGCSKRGMGIFSRTPLPKIGPPISKVGPPKYKMRNQITCKYCHSHSSKASLLLLLPVSRNNLFM